jgi:NADH-quinone oxidoreductase subunit J
VLGTTESIGRTLYTSYSFPFEMASLILIAAAVGAIILAKKRLV